MLCICRTRHFSVNKQKWVPLEIDIAKSRDKRERSPKHLNNRVRNGGEGNVLDFIECSHFKMNYCLILETLLYRILNSDI